MTDDATATENGITATYAETDTERRLVFERGESGEATSGGASEATTAGPDTGTSAGRTAVIAQNIEGYAMLKVHPTVDGDELERYYGFDMALDHAAELLGVSPHDLPVPEAAADMGM